MKKYLLTIIALLLIGATTFAQTPQSFNYQAVLYDISENILTNKNVKYNRLVAYLLDYRQ